MVALAAMGNPNAVMSAEALEEKNANLTGAGRKTQNGSMESNENRPHLSFLSFFFGLARILLCLESL
jgi:hypothetical protein